MANSNKNQILEDEKYQEIRKFLAGTIFICPHY